VGGDSAGFAAAERLWRGRDDRHLFRAAAPVPVDPLEELIRVVNEAQERDAGDERPLYIIQSRRTALVFSTAAARSTVTVRGGRFSRLDV